MRKIAIAVLSGILGLASTLRADNKSDWQVGLYGYGESFSWKETYAGAKVVDESGPLFGLGLDFAIPLSANAALFGLADAFLGQVDYKGGIENQDGSVTPFNTQTTYGGLRGEFALGTPLPLSSRLKLVPLAGVGGRTWLRSLDTSLGDSQHGAYGYDEYWTTIYALGGGLLHLNLDGNHALFASGQLNLPFWNRVDADLSNVGGPSNVHLTPGRKPGWHAEAGVTFGRAGLSAFYEKSKFGQSDVDANQFFQPQSEERLIGGRFTYTL